MNLKDGDKVIFIKEYCRYAMKNSTNVALLEIQDAFAGEADFLGLKTEENIFSLVKELGKEKLEKQVL